MTHPEPNAGPPGDGGVPPVQSGNTPPLGQSSYPLSPNQPPYPRPPYQPGNTPPGRPGWTPTRWLIGAGVAALVIVCALVAFGTGSSGYNDPDTLAASLMEETNSAISDPSSPKYSASGD